MHGFAAFVPAAHHAAANAALDAAGFGPNNFSVLCGPEDGATHAGLHCWADPAFRAAVEALPAEWGVAIHDAHEVPVDTFAALVLDHLGVTWPPASGWMDSLPEIGDEREFDGKTWRNEMAGNPYRPPHGWTLVSAPTAAQPWSASGFYTQGQIVTNAEGTRQWQLQAATETAAVGREPWQAYMWAVWQEVT